MRKNVLIFILLLSFFTGIYAQKTNSNQKLLEILSKKNVLTQEDIDEIITASYSTEEPQNAIDNSFDKVKNIFGNTPYVKLGGYGLLTYKYNEYAKNHHNFKPRVVFISLQGKFTNTLSYGVLFELVNPKLYELYAEWTPAKYFGTKIGQFKVPFTLENLISLTKLETIYYNRTISSLAGMDKDVLYFQNKINSTGRDIGVQLSGSFANQGSYDLVEYKIGLFQGAGINNVDPDNSKDFAGTLLLQPTKGFRLAGGVYFGEATYANLEQGIILNKHVRNRWATSADYKSDRFSARAEWIKGNDAGIQKEGVYGLASYYMLPKKLNVVCNIDYYNNDKNLNEEVVDYTAGINYYFYTQCRLQLNYTYSDYSSKWNTQNSNMIAAQLQVVF